jgi:hypothetical protein
LKIWRAQGDDFRTSFLNDFVVSLARIKLPAALKPVIQSKLQGDLSYSYFRKILTTRKIRATRTVRVGEGIMAGAKRNGKQNVTISLDRKTIQKAKICAARRSTSISGLLAHQIEILVGEEEAYEQAERQAMTLLDQGFHLGGAIRVGRDDLHER